MPVPILPGITAKTVSTPRLTTRVLFSGPEVGTPVLFLHGNASSATFWEETMLALPAGFRGIAPDQRGYGDADPAKHIDATRGTGDLADDALALLDHLGVDHAHVVGHSAGGSVIWRLLIAASHRFLTATLAAPGSPYGFGGSHGLDGAPNAADFAGTGGGTVNREFARRVAEGDRSEENPQSAPRIVMNSFYWKPPFRPAREEGLLSSLLSTHVGDQDYPGDLTASPNWPGVAPGAWGMVNALSPKYAGDVSRLFAIAAKPPILWIRGAEDQIVGDNSFFDLVTLGTLGYLPGFPGADVLQPQPMIGQTRAVLEQYQAAGGAYTEVVFADCGHTPFVEKFDEFNAVFHKHIG
ncbi:MAG: alpha/beta fold hydrolase [Anaerolineae bacterium]|nr:alpha/beta fold hydrolase [Anaerolineae bacterium]